MPDASLGRFNRAVEKFFNVKGGPTVVDVGHQIMSMLPFDKGVDQRYLEGWNRFAAFSSVAAVAAAFGRFRLRNPTASNVIAVIEQFNYFLLAAVVDTPFLTWGATTTDLTNIVSSTFARMDPRGNPQPSLIVSQVAQASGGLPFMERVASANVNIDFINTHDQEMPILPGQVVDLQSQVANTAIFAGIMWRERALESSELT